MNKPVITVKNISKSYNINHEMKASVGNVTFRDAIIDTLKKPKELLTGHIMKKEKFWALKDIDFEINQGDVVGIIGKNGSGKSTLLKIMSRITEPTTGEIVMNGRVASLLEVGTGFHPELTGRENVYFNGSILGMKKKEIDAKFDEIVAFSEVEKFLDTPVKFYSSGMYVRLAFAVAAHLDPDVLIIDEVLAVGDAAFQKKCLDKMKQVAGEGRTVIYVSHSSSSVRLLCSKAILLDKGRLLAFGSTEKILELYSGLYIPKGKKGEKIIAIDQEGFVLHKMRINGQLIADKIKIKPDTELSIKALYSSKYSNKKLRIAIGIKNYDSEKYIIYTHNDLESQGYVLRKSGEISLKIKIPRISPGKYLINIQVWIDDHEYIKEEKLCEAVVSPYRSFRSKELLEGFPADILVDSDWKFTNK